MGPILRTDDQLLGIDLSSYEHPIVLLFMRIQHLGTKFRPCLEVIQMLFLGLIHFLTVRNTQQRMEKWIVYL